MPMKRYKPATSYKIADSTVDEKPEIASTCLKRMVGASGFEPPTSWSRTRRASQAALRPDNGASLTRSEDSQNSTSPLSPPTPPPRSSPQKQSRRRDFSLRRE